MGNKMKILTLILLSVLTAHNAFAGVCETTLDSRLREEFAEKQWEYHGIGRATEKKVYDVIENSDELDEIGREAIRAHLEEQGNEFYITGGNGNYSAVFEELLVVSRFNCRILNRAVIYVE